MPPPNEFHRCRRRYYGGITTWNNGQTILNAPSPGRLVTAKPSWCLAAEAGNNFIPDGRGYDGFTPGFPQKVPHQRPGKKHPDGGNQLFVDGSIRWVKLEKMYFLTSWNPGTRRLFACPGGLGKCHPITTQRHETHGAGFPAQTRLFEQLPASYPAK